MCAPFCGLVPIVTRRWRRMARRSGAHRGMRLSSEELAYEATTEGHRRSYLDIWHRELGLTPLVRRPSVATFFRLLRARRVLISTVDDHYAFSIAVGMLRALCFRKTAGILLRPLPKNTLSTKHRIKSLFLRLAKWTGRIHLVSLIPFEAEPDIELISSGWIFDPQWWDARELYSANNEAQIANYIRAARNYRIVVAFIGSAHTGKGIGHFLNLWNNSLEIRRQYLFVIGGKVDSLFDSQLSDFVENGGIAFNRFITDSEMGSLYDCADLIWVFYEPSYDQSSGIFGRSLITKKTPIVRKDSRLAIISRLLSISAIELDSETISRDFNTVAKPHQSEGPSNTEMRRISLETLTRLL